MSTIYPNFGYIRNTSKFWVYLSCTQIPPYTQILGTSRYGQILGISTIYPNPGYIHYIAKFWTYRIFYITNFCVYPTYNYILGISFIYPNSGYNFVLPYAQIQNISTIYPNSGHVFHIPKFCVYLPNTETASIFHIPKGVETLTQRP